MNASWQKTKIQNVGTGPLDASINVDGNIVDEVTDFMCAPISSKTRRRKDIANKRVHPIVLAAPAMSDISRVWFQMRLTLNSKSTNAA